MTLELLRVLISAGWSIGLAVDSSGESRARYVSPCGTEHIGDAMVDFWTTPPGVWDWAVQNGIRITCEAERGSVI